MTDQKLIWEPYPKEDNPVLFDARRARRVGSLFYETSQDKNRTPIFTLKDYAINGYISAYQLYMDSVDEADAAFKLVGTLSHWRKMVAIRWFREGLPEHNFSGIDQWRKDMAARDASIAKKTLLTATKTGDIAAAKKLFDSAINGKMAGISAAKTENKTKPAPRRGVQKAGNVVDLASALENIRD